MANTALASAFVTIVPSMRGFDSKLKQELGTNLGSVGDSAGAELGGRMKGGFLKNFAIGGAVAGIFASLTSSITASLGMIVREAAQASDATDKFKKTLSFAGVDNKTIEGLAKSTKAYADQTVYDLATIQNATAQLGANGVPNYEKLVEAAGNLNAVAGGSKETFSSVSMVLTQTAGAGKLTTENWNQLANAIPGASGMLQKALLENQAYTGNFRKAMEKGQITADEFNAALMQLGSDPIAVEAAKSTQTFEGALANLKSTLVSGMMEPLNALKPQITGAISFISKTLSSIFSGDFDLAASVKGAVDKLIAWVNGGGIQSMIQGFVDMRTKIIDALAQSLPEVLNSLIASLGAMLPQIVTTLLNMIPQLLATAQTVFESLYKAIETVLPTLLTTLTTMLPQIVQTLTAMLPGIIQGAINLFMGIVESVFRVMPKVIVALLDALPKIIQSLLSMLPTLVNGSIQLFIGLVQGLVKVIPTLLTTLTTVVLPKLIQTIVSLIPVLIPAAINLFLALVQGLAKAIPEIIAAVVKLIPVIVKALIQMQPQLIDAGIQIVKGLVKGIVDNAPKLIGGAIKGLGDLVVGGFKALLGIHSPSRVFIELGKNIIQGLNKGLLGDEQSVLDTMQRVADWVENAFNDGKIYRKTAQAAQKLVATYTAMLQPVVKQHDAIVEKLNDAQDVLKTKIEERLNYIKSITEKFGSKLNQDEKMTAQDAIDQLKARIAKTKELSSAMAELSALGLSGDLYQQIVDSGNLDFAKSILAGGSATVQELNALAEEANKTALDLGTQAGDILFNKGIEVAQGVVDGLKQKEAELSAIMSNIAQSFSNAISNVISSDTRQADTAAAEAAAKAQDKAQSAYDAAVKKYGKNSKQAKTALTALNKANATEKATKNTLNTNLRASMPTVQEPAVGSSSASTQVVNYYAAPNQSLDSEQELMTAIKRAKVVAAW